jgi:hypothetical protein
VSPYISERGSMLSSSLTGNHSASERPWLASFAPRLAEQMNTAAGQDGMYEVVCSKADREPLQVV